MAAEADPQEEEKPKKKGILMPLVIGLVLAGVGGGGGFWAVTSGPLASMFGGSEEVADDSQGDDYADEEHDADSPARVEVGFVPLETLTISLGEEGAHRHLIFSAQLEVEPDHAEEVTALSPRVLDVLNSYLRIVGVDELSQPASLARMRAQMLHRIQIVTGEGRVRDLLITQFVVN